MISEGSCDTEDWGNDAENTALSSQELITFLHIQISAVKRLIAFKIKYVVYIICVYILCVYSLSIYKCTHMHVYISEKYVLFIYEIYL